MRIPYTILKVIFAIFNLIFFVINAVWALTSGGFRIHPSIIYLSRTSKHINRVNQFKITYTLGLDAKVHVGLLNGLHVAHKNNTKIEIHLFHVATIICVTQMFG